MFCCVEGVLRTVVVQVGSTLLNLIVCCKVTVRCSRSSTQHCNVSCNEPAMYRYSVKNHTGYSWSRPGEGLRTETKTDCVRVFLGTMLQYYRTKLWPTHNNQLVKIHDKLMPGHAVHSSIGSIIRKPHEEQNKHHTASILIAPCWHRQETPYHLLPIMYPLRQVSYQC
jgi:hypothetical protein